MNDKASQRPPSLYTKEEEAMENYVKSQEKEHDGTMDVTYDAGIEPTKSSGMFRFGKVIANTFNPANIWQGINGIWKEREKETKVAPRKDVQQDRQAKAIEAYADLKKSGYKETRTGPVQRENSRIPAIKYEDPEDVPRDNSRDSGIDVDGDCSSSDQKGGSEMTNLDEALKVPPLTAAHGRSASPFSNASSGRKSSMHFRKPSFQNLKNVKSQIHLPSAKKLTETPFSPLVQRNDFATPSITGPGLRRQRSKRDITRQTKLSKKVSDLENKLQVARQELELSISTAPPVPDLPMYFGRKPFVPGGLSSLPSERNMTPQQIADNGGPALAESGRTANRGRTFSERLVEEPRHAHELEDLAATISSKSKSTTRKRVVRDANNENMRKNSKEVADALESEAVKSAASPMKSGRHMKPQDFKKASSHSPAGVRKRQLPKVPAKTPQNSPSITTEDMPPVPVKIPTFDPSLVNQANIMSMRTVPNKALFGTLAEDLTSLHKEFPQATDHDLVEYLKSLGWQPRTIKTTDHTSVVHDNRPASPFLGRPSASPMRTRSKNSKRGISPPPPSLTSAKKLRLEPFAGETQIKSDDLAKSKAAKKTYGRSIEDAKYHKDKPLPEIQKEEYEWDEDVF